MSDAVLLDYSVAEHAAHDTDGMHDSNVDFWKNFISITDC